MNLSQRLQTGEPMVMGIINLTPDSFSDGGQLWRDDGIDLDLVARTAAAMQAEGAEILDLGGESTRPGAAPVSMQQELDRVLPALQRIRAEVDIAISVDTSNAQLMNQAAALGADMLNDVRALQNEGALQAAAESGLPVCLMHMQGTPADMQQDPHYQDVAAEVAGFLDERVQQCLAAGISRENLVLDPGFGFGKSLQHNLRLLQQLRRFSDTGFPVLVGVSRKRMVAEITGRKDPQQRLAGSLALAQFALDQGARIIRAHDVAATCDMMRTWKAITQKDIQ